jgi:DNA repair protein RadB
VGNGKISAGSYDLNVWLNGGYESGVITTLYGGPGSGKTNFCMLAAVSQAKKGKKVIFVDTEGGFSSERVKQLIASKSVNGVERSKETDSLKVEEVLSHLLILKPTNFKEQQAAFDQILKHLTDQVALIIVDGMTMLYRLDFADARAKEKEDLQAVNAALTKQMRLLVELARKRDIPVIVTNQVYHWDDGIRMVGGDIIQYWSKCLIEMTNDRGRRAAHIRKHRSMGDKTLEFQIYDGGVRKKGWI